MQFEKTDDARHGALYEAKLCFFSGQPGRARQLLIPLLQKEPDAEAVRLYLACCETAADAGAIPTILGQGFSRLWEDSRTLRRQMPDQPDQPHSGSYRNRIWDLGAEPVDNLAFNQMGATTRKMRKAFADRKR